MLVTREKRNVRARIRNWNRRSHRNKSHVLVRGSRLRKYNQVNTNIMTVFVFLPQEFGTQILYTRLRVVPRTSTVFRALVS
jgi:hypothetical protein